MSRLVARIKILPSEAEVKPQAIVGSLTTNLPSNMQMIAHAEEPIAFGLNAVVADFTLDDSEGQMDLLEDSIKKIELVGEIEVINVSRQSVKMK